MFRIIISDKLDSKQRRSSNIFYFSLIIAEESRHSCDFVRCQGATPDLVRFLSNLLFARIKIREVDVGAGGGGGCRLTFCESFMTSGSNVGRHADGERDGYRGRRTEGAGRHEQQRPVRTRSRAREAAPDVDAGADQLKRGFAASEEAQVSQWLLRPTGVLSSLRGDN